MTSEQAEQIIKSQQNILTSLKPSLSRKMYFKIEEKINTEEKEFHALLDIQDARDKTKAQYSHVLDEYYFEQKLMN